MTMRRKGLLCLLVLLLLLAGYLFTSHPGSSRSPASLTLHRSSAPSTLLAQSLTLPMVAENAPGLVEGSLTVEPQPAFLSGGLSMHHLVWEVNGSHLFPAKGSKPSDMNASLLVMIARALGLSSLVLRE